jgi:hypothetical protein
VAYSPRDNREKIKWEIIRLFRGLTHQWNAHFPTPGPVIGISHHWEMLVFLVFVQQSTKDAQKGNVGK